MSFKNWDERIAPHLRCIDNCCTWIGLYASKMQVALEMLPARPAWETLARDNLNKLETTLRQLLASVQEAQRRYDELPVLIESRFDHHFVIEPDDEQLRYETETGVEHA